MRLGATVAAAVLAMGLGTAQAEMPYVPPYEPPLEGPVDNSFVAGTKVLTPSGLKNIEDIADGDIVISFDPHTQGNVEARVHGVNSRTERAIYEMGIGGQTIQVTRDHPFLSTQGWKRVIETSIGNTIVGFDGAEYKIDTCRIRTGNFTVYNFEVELTGTFYVSDLRLLAH